MRRRLATILVLWLVRGTYIIAGDEDARCGMLNAEGHVKDGASYYWMIQSLVIETSLPPNPDAEMVKTIHFLLSSPLLNPLPAMCQGVANSPDIESFQTCTKLDGKLMDDPWLSFSYNFLLEGFVQMNQTWTCDFGGNRCVFAG